MSTVLSKEKNVLGGPLLACSYAPLTGFFRDGCCATHGAEGVAHLVCVKVTEEFLDFSRVSLSIVFCKEVMQSAAHHHGNSRRK